MATCNACKEGKLDHLQDMDICYVCNVPLVRAQIKILRPGAHVPTKGHPGDQGWDLYACESLTLVPKTTVNVPCGVAVLTPSGWGYSIRGRSSLNKKGIHVVYGTVDPGYTGELFALLYNSGSDMYQVQAGDRVAQLVFEQVISVSLMEVKDLRVPDGERGDRGFGSTGK